MLILFPAAVVLLLVVLFYRENRLLRCAILKAFLMYGIILTGLNEMLSIYGVLNKGWLTLSWLAIATILFVPTYRYLNLSRVGEIIVDMPDKPVCLILAFIMLTTLSIALICPPNNWDAMTYHMSRVMHWIQNQSVAHYRTNILRQIEMNPWAEYAITNFQILSDGDRFANLVQWLSMAGSIIGVSLIAEKFGVNQKGQLIAALFAATIPMGILQATGAQNDCVVSLWLVCLVYFGISFCENVSWPLAVAVGSSLGLAVLTKGTAYLYALPISIWIFIMTIRSTGLKTIKYMSIALLMVLLINGGHYIRNYNAFGNILSSGEKKYSNDIYGYGSLSSNMVRNIALELAGQSQYLNNKIYDSVAEFHKMTNLDLNDPKTTWLKTSFALDLGRHEDAAGNPLHVLLITFALFVILFNGPLRNQDYITSYILSVLASFILFCFYLKWQPWHSRLLLPLIIMGSPLVAVAVMHFKNYVGHIVIVALLANSLPFLFLNESRPLISSNRGTSILFKDRDQLYFNNRPNDYEKYYEISHRLYVNKCSDLAVDIGPDTWEYPLWALSKKLFNNELKITHVNVNNKSSTLPQGVSFFCDQVTIKR